MASQRSRPAWRSAPSAKSIRKMTFFFTIPIKRIIPIRAMMIVSRWAKLSKRMASTL